jgi:hypothetical protein
MPDSNSPGFTAGSGGEGDKPVQITGAQCFGKEFEALLFLQILSLFLFKS